MARSVPSVPALDGERVLAELGWVRALARSLVRDPSLAEDVAQEAWLLARERPPRARAERGLRAWLARVTRTLVRSRLRGERARERREERCARLEASSPPASEVVERTQLQQRLVAAVMALDEPYRSAVLWRHVDGLSAREIAARQGTSVANARQRVARGLACLRSTLDREHGGDGRSWVFALVPFLRPSGPLTAAAALLGGTAVVKTSSSLLVAVAAAVLGFVLLRHSFERESPPRVEGRETAASAPLAAVEPIRGREPERTPSTRGEAREPAVAASAPAAPVLRVHARLLDARGRPLPGAELAAEGGVAKGSPARAGADGGVELVLRLDPSVHDRLVHQVVASPSAKDARGTDVLSFVASAPGCRDAVRTEARPEPDDVMELGDVRLYPVGSLGGIVRDLAGAPLAGAEVRLELPAAVEERLAALFGPEYSLQERRMQADADGRFVYDEVSEGVWCLWAGASGRTWAHSEPLRVERAGAAPEVELVLAPLPDANRIHGLVLAAEGGSLAGVELSATPAGSDPSASYALSDAQGRFDLAVEAGAPYRVRAWQEQPARTTTHGQIRNKAYLLDDRHAPLKLEGVTAGASELVLVLQPARFLDVAVVERGGRPALGVTVREMHGDVAADAYYPVEREGERAGTARVLVPELPFTLEVRTEEFVLASAGPFDPEAPPPFVRLELVPLAHLRGTLRVGGEPVADAVVQLMQLPAPGAIDYLYGFPARLSGEDLRGTTTDARGRFELPVPFRIECALFVEKDGYAAAERSPLALDPGRDEMLDLELDRGGAVEGRVLVPAGESAGGILVRLCRGDMRVHEAVSDAEGRYRVEALTPGPFMVLAERKRAGLSFGFAASPVESVRRERFEFPWRLEVRAGETTRYDVDLAAQEVATLAGSLRIDGAAPVAAVARLVRAGEPWLARRFDAEQVPLGADGSFAFEERRCEELVLVLEPAAGALAGTSLVQELALERGENSVRVELASASLRGRLPAGEGGPFALVCEPVPGVVTVTPLTAAGGGFEMASVPACDEARLVAWSAGAERGDPRTWKVVRRFALKAGDWTVSE